ncbi:MAG: hypothetical protein EOO90_20050 [Pedobacter sp.]|nr:MAG: hypothetical protein EOO90_20050 [Pedobacter sp.]
MLGKGVEEWVWQSVFNAYFNIIICKEILAFVKSCIEKGLLKEAQIHDALKRVNQKLQTTGSGFSLAETNYRFESILDSIESYSNDPEMPKPIGLHAGTLINVLLEELRQISLFQSSRFHVFIDEFEELNVLQQKQINTLVKQSRYWLVYDIGVKSNGRYSEETISGEIIQEPHDFIHHYPESSSFNRQQDYEELLFSICKKRLQDYIPEKFSQNPDFYDINFYLHYYGRKVELEEFASKPKFKKIKTLLKEMIDIENLRLKIYNSQQIEDVYTVLIETSPDIVRMHISLLNRKTKVTVKDLYENAKVNSAKYKDWKGNMLFATYFLLCKELDVNKKYHGLKTFSMLSSGVIRSFLEICESAFDFAFSDNFSFENPRMLTLEEQTQAAHYVSQSKVAKIDGFVPDGVYLKRLTLALGRLFYLKHTDSAATLGEPEPNHFFTKPSELKSLSNEAMRVLEHAVMHNVLQFDMPTKEKNDSIETTDYHLNHIFCPYFKISHRRKRKLYIDPKDLKILLVGNNSDVDKVIKSLANQQGDVIQGVINFFGNDLSGKI